MPRALPRFDMRVPFCLFEAVPEREDGRIQKDDEVLVAAVHGDIELITPEETYAGKFDVACWLRLQGTDTGVRLMGIDVLGEPKLVFKEESTGEVDGLSMYRDHGVVVRAKLLNTITDYLIGKRRIGRDIRLLFPAIGIVEDE